MDNYVMMSHLCRCKGYLVTIKIFVFEHCMPSYLYTPVLVSMVTRNQRDVGMGG